VALQLAVEAVVPLNFTVLVPLVAPKFEPVIVTAVPPKPEAGDRLVMVGAGGTVSRRTVATVLVRESPECFGH